MPNRRLFTVVTESPRRAAAQSRSIISYEAGSGNIPNRDVTITQSNVSPEPSTSSRSRTSNEFPCPLLARRASETYAGLTSHP